MLTTDQRDTPPNGNRWGIGTPQLARLRRTVWHRELRWPGEVLVAPGDSVEGSTALASGRLPAWPVLVPLGQIPPVVHVGDRVVRGQILARRKPLIGRAVDVRATSAGTVRDFVEGYALIAPSAEAGAVSSLAAQLPGTVAAVYAHWGADIEGYFGLVRGTSGGGPEFHGRLGEDIGVYVDPMTPNMVAAAVAQGVRAVIAPRFTAPPGRPLTYVLTERAGDGAMAPPLAEVLLRHLGQAAAIEFTDCPSLAFVGIESPEQARPAEERFGVGSWVRLIDGRVGRLVGVDSRPRMLPSEIRAVTAEIDLGDATEVEALESLEWVA